MVNLAGNGSICIRKCWYWWSCLFSTFPSFSHKQNSGSGEDMTIPSAPSGAEGSAGVRTWSPAPRPSQQLGSDFKLNPKSEAVTTSPTLQSEAVTTSPALLFYRETCLSSEGRCTCHSPSGLC